jgi:hypothetical protein
MSRDVGSPRFASPVASTHRSVPHVPSPSHLRWARRLTAGTPASKLCSPRESVPRRPRNLARPRTPVGALLGFSPSRALSTTVPGSVSRVGTRGAFALPRTFGRPAVTVAFRDPDSDAWAREPRIRRRSDSIEVRSSPSGSDPAHGACLERFVRQSPAPSLNPAGPISDGASCPCPLSAAPRASLPLAAVTSRREAPSAGPRRRSFVEPSTRPRSLRSRLATDPLAKIDLVVPSPSCDGRRIDPDATGSRHLRQLGRPAPSRGAGR